MSEELSRVEDLLENGVEEPVLPMSELEAILRGEKIKPHSRVAELLLQYNPSDILIEKSITENGTYYASADNAAGYFKVVVDTPVIPPVVLDHLVETITQNGTYNYTSEHDGYSDAEITVNVPTPQPVVASKTITENDTYVAADEQLDGYSQVVVNVPPTPMDTMNITHNGTYHPPTGRGFDEVNVTVPLGSKSITANGTYVATDDNLDGYSSVAVDVPQIGIKDIPNTPTPIATFSDGTSNPLKSLTVSIEPVQDLHGYDAPWVGGAGKNKLNYDVFKTTTFVKSTGVWENNGVTITATEIDAYTNTAQFPVNARIAVNEGETITLSWESTDLIHGLVYLFPNGSTTGFVSADNYNTKEVSYTVGSGITYITYRFGVSNSGETIHYKNIMARKSGNATFAPYENICPISGWTEEVVSRTGKNLVESTLANTTINIVGEINVSGGSTTFDMHIAKIIKGETYTIQSDESQNVNQKFVGGFFYDMPQLGSISYNNARLANTPATFTAPIDGYVAFRTSHNYAFAQIEIGSTATTYEPYAGTTTTIPFTDSQGNPVEVYGGSVDVTNGGEQPQTLGEITLNGSENYTINSEGTDKISFRHWEGTAKANADGFQISNRLIYDRIAWRESAPEFSFVVGTNELFLTIPKSTASTVEELKTWIASNNIQIIYEHATPTTFYTQPTSIKSLDGENNVGASTGEILSGQYFGYVYPELGTKTITENGTYTATDDNLDGYSQVTINVAGGGGGEPSEFYRYIPAVNGTIVLRQKYTKVLGQYEVENKVFFNGYHLTDYDTIPAEIYNYIPDIDVSGANWTDNTSTTQDGWISVAKHTYNQLRCYTQSWGSYLSNIDIWAVVDFTGGNGQTLPWSDPYDVDPTPDITLINAQISSISNKYMGAISTNLPVVAGYYAISHYNSDQIAGGTNLALVKIESLPTTITLGGLANFRLNITSNSVEVDNYDGSAKDVYMSIIKIPEYAICIKPD